MHRPVVVLALVAALVSACGHGHQAPAKAPFVYRVGPGDVLALTVWREPELTRERLAVGPDGTFGVPGAAPVNASGKTLAELVALVQQSYVAAKTLVAPAIGLTLIEIRSARVNVLGEVRIPSPIPFRDGMSVVDAIAAAGGHIPAWAKIEDVRLIRGSLSNPQYIPVDLTEIFEGDEKDVFLQPGDLVVVPPKYVTRFDRYVTQMLAPLRLGTTSAAGAASVGTTIGTTTIVAPGF